MNDQEFDEPYAASGKGGFLQKFESMLDVSLKEEQRVLLFKNVHRFTLDSAIESLQRFAVGLQGGSKYLKTIEFVSGVVRDLHETGVREHQGGGELPGWFADGMPVRVKRGRRWDHGWLFQERGAYKVVIYRRSQLSGLWNFLYCSPSQAEYVQDGPMMPPPRQPLAVRKALYKHPVPEFKIDLTEDEWTHRLYEIALKWLRQVLEVLVREPGDPVQHVVGYYRYREEVRLGHPVEPRGWDERVEPPKPKEPEKPQALAAPF